MKRLKLELQKELVRLCDALNRAGIKYIVVGGCAVILHVYYRTTHDIGLIVDTAPETIRKMKEVLYKVFGSEDVFNINDDVAQYAVVRIAPESEDIVIDLIGKIGAISFEAVD
ncbi:MAG: hypothetical protein IT392_00175 [Nitrospirae bacterium]|nr:hypothetical protein [Nitrospirota bacterium]